MDPRTPIEQPDNATDELFGENLVAPEMKDEAIQQIELEAEVEQQPEEEIAGGGQHAPGGRRRGRMHRLLEAGKNRRTTQLLLQIWKSDYSIIAFLIMMTSFYLMKETGSPVIGLLFFLFAMAEIDAMLSMFVVRLSFHQNQHGFYRTEDFERDWLRYRMLLTMVKAALLFVIATSCATPATSATATSASATIA